MHPGEKPGSSEGGPAGRRFHAEDCKFRAVFTGKFTEGRSSLLACDRIVP